MSFLHALQSVLFYVASCSPCHQAIHQYRLKQQAKEQREARAADRAQEGGYQQPEPFATNPYWSEEINMGPHIVRKQYKSPSMRHLTSAGGDTVSIGGSSIAANSATNTINNADTRDKTTMQSRKEFSASTGASGISTAFLTEGNSITTFGRLAKKGINTASIATERNTTATINPAVNENKKPNKASSIVNTTSLNSPSPNEQRGSSPDATDLPHTLPKRGRQSYELSCGTTIEPQPEEGTTATLLSKRDMTIALPAKEDMTIETSFKEDNTVIDVPPKRVRGRYDMTSSTESFPREPTPESVKQWWKTLDAFKRGTLDWNTIPGDWNFKRYQRADEEVWGSELSVKGHKLMGAIKRAGSSAGRIVESSLNKDVKRLSDDESKKEQYFAPFNPPVNDYHPPIVRQPTVKGAVQWMVQPPPPAKLMEGKVPVRRGNSSNASHSSFWLDRALFGKDDLPDDRADKVSTANAANRQ
ncbi:hypothetical protein GQX73_g46 [Xylaria multiplex]|uniref:Uncharacterized protein n=1 Tax=Xylaria multiplex TaxID=323545 RepID=A0A7C8IVS5_9PEZI|nr:hypothetical protein GQX73_g46 [Xylaria multiplex]